MKQSWSDLIESPLVQGLLSEAGRLGVPTRAEERELIARAQAGDTAARDELTVRHAPFTITQVKKMGAWGMDYLDLFQEAMIGLGCAIDKFDLEDPKRVRFITYAVWWIRQAMMIASQDQAGIIRVPVNRHTQMNRIRKLVNSGKDVDVYDVAKMFRVTESVARGMLEQSATPMSLNVITKKSREDDATELGDLLEEPFFDNVADDDEGRWAVDLIENDHKMTPREKYVVVQRYFYGRTLDDIALEYGITRERIRQVQNEAMVRVKRIAKDYDKRCGFTQNDRRQMLSMGG